MGRDKALLEFDGQTLIERAVGKLDAVCAVVAIAGGGDSLRQFGTVVPDRWAGCGPLGGIGAALEVSEWDWNLFLAVDVPLVPVELLRRLAMRCLQTSGVAVMMRVEGRIEPLCAVYHRRVLTGIEASLAQGNYKVSTAIEGVSEVEYLEVDGDDANWFLNVNTPQELLTAERCVGRYRI